jgi:hypothetical protein
LSTKIGKSKIQKNVRVKGVKVNWQYCISHNYITRELASIRSLTQPEGHISMATQKDVTTNKMTACKLRGQTIHFSDSIVTEHTGKKIPLSEGIDDPHKCEQWEHPTGVVTPAITATQRYTLTTNTDPKTVSISH